MKSKKVKTLRGYSPKKDRPETLEAWRDLAAENSGLSKEETEQRMIDSLWSNDFYRGFAGRFARAVAVEICDNVYETDKLSDYVGSKKTYTTVDAFLSAHEDHKLDDETAQTIADGVKFPYYRPASVPKIDKALVEQLAAARAIFEIGGSEATTTYLEGRGMEADSIKQIVARLESEAENAETEES